MASFKSVAQALEAGDTATVTRLAASLLKPSNNNFVERPWGGTRLREFKGLHPLPDQRLMSGLGLGEAFEICACEADAEAGAHPSLIRFEDGSTLPLPTLLGLHGEALLGRAFVEHHGSSFPLLPKMLNVRELLSVQGHPEGHTEVYVIIDAEPGATIRVGFNRDLNPQLWAAQLRNGLDLQRQLIALCGDGVDPLALQGILQEWFACRGNGPSGIASTSEVAGGSEIAGASEVAGASELVGASEIVGASGIAGTSGIANTLLHHGKRTSIEGELNRLLHALKDVYWAVLDSLSSLPVKAGDVIYNATPARILAQTGRRASAEVHALGNPEQRELLALEIRCPGPTFRAWDNVRFPMRPVDVETAIASLNLKRTEPDEFRVDPVCVGGQPGIYRSVITPEFRLEHLRPSAARSVRVVSQGPHCLHAIRGSTVLRSRHGGPLGTLARGESAIVPTGVDSYEVDAIGEDAEIVKVDLMGACRNWA